MCQKFYPGSFPGWPQEKETVLDFQFSYFDSYTPWRNQDYGDDDNWNRRAWYFPSKFIRNGPTTDYDGERYYAYCHMYNTNSLKKIATMAGPAIPRGPRCLIFHYHMFGDDVGEMRLKTEDPATGVTKFMWAMQQSQSSAWRRHRVMFNSESNEQLFFEASSGFDKGAEHQQRFSAVMLDSIWLRNGTDLCMGYMDCNFDNSAYLDDCGWYQNDTDDVDWIRRQGETPAGNELTGPSSDHTTGYGSYLYFDASNLNAGASARVHMPNLPEGKHCLTFYYHMHGPDVGRLRVFYTPIERVDSLNGFFLPYDEITVWDRSGNQGNWWKKAMVPLDLSYPQGMIFEAFRGNGDGGDIAIDDVVVLKGECPSDRGLSCSFEHGDFCAWQVDNSQARKFEISQGKTKNAPMSGPEGDHTGLYAGGRYAMISSENAISGEKARISSPVIPAGPVCVSFAYSIRGRSTGSLAVYQDDKVVQRIRGSQTEFFWRTVNIDISSETPRQIHIEAILSSSSLSDMAIDDIRVTDGFCGEMVNQSIRGYEQVSSLKLVSHEILPEPVETPVISICITICQQTKGCRSVNYATSTKLCQLNNATYESDPYNAITDADSSYFSMSTQLELFDSEVNSLCTEDDVTCGQITDDCIEANKAGFYACKCQHEGRSCLMAKDCSVIPNAVKLEGYIPKSVFLLRPFLNNSFFPAQCEMDPSTGKVFTVLMQRNNGAVRFHDRTFDSYTQFFGSPDQEYWVGLENMHQLTNLADNGYVVEAGEGATQFTPLQGMASAFKIGDSSENYAAKSAQVSGTMIDASWSADTPFTTIDQDNDSNSAYNCAQIRGNGGWWYTNCGANGILTGPYRPGEDMSSSKDGFMSSDFNSGSGLTSAKLKITRI